MHLSLPRRRAGWIICCFKNLDRKRLSLSLGPKKAWRVMDGSTPDPTHPPSRQQAAVGGSRASSKATHAPSPHTQNHPQSATGQVPAFHLAALPRVRRWSRWSRLYGVWVPGSCQAISLVPVDHLTWLCDSVCPASSQVQGHPPHSSEGS